MKRSITSRQRVIGGLLAVLAVAIVVLPADSPTARAEACTTGLPQRVLVSADLSWNDVQSCMDNEWVTVMRIQRGTGTTYSVNQPTEPKWQIDVGSLFDVSAFNPLAALQKAKELAASGIALSEDEKALTRLAWANVKAQSLVLRGILPPNEGCKVRSRPFTENQRRFGGHWAAPVSVLPAGQPTTITYALDASVTPAAKSIILSAIAQYAAAIDAQDAAFQYPSQIVPYDPAHSTVPPTITFKIVPSLSEDDGTTVSGLTDKRNPREPRGFENRWIYGDVSLNQNPATLTPFLVGHEIGHVMGLDHMTENVDSTMKGTGNGPLTQPWSASQTESPMDSRAFDPCMFLPTN